MKNKLTIPTVLAASVFLTAPVTWAKDNAYKCVSRTGEITLQDFNCKSTHKETILPLMKFNDTSADKLREFELTTLERLHEHDILRKQFDYERVNEYVAQQKEIDNAIKFENLRHEHAKEMFDKHYRHFWIYGVANGNGSFPLSYSILNNGYVPQQLPVNPAPLSTSP